jgi:molecular chaperone DnaK (HSP70)
VSTVSATFQAHYQMGVLAIDFGTSRIKAAYWDEQRGEATVLPLGNGGRLYAPSLFHVNKEGRISASAMRPR